MLSCENQKKLVVNTNFVCRNNAMGLVSMSARLGGIVAPLIVPMVSYLVELLRRHL